jgi:hypothetical protein
MSSSTVHIQLSAALVYTKPNTTICIVIDSISSDEINILF